MNFWTFKINFLFKAKLIFWKFVATRNVIYNISFCWGKKFSPAIVSFEKLISASFWIISELVQLEICNIHFYNCQNTLKSQKVELPTYYKSIPDPFVVSQNRNYTQEKYLEWTKKRMKYFIKTLWSISFQLDLRQRKYI